MPPAPIITTLRSGDTAKQYPFTIAIIANPILEAPWRSDRFIEDAIVYNKQAFDDAANYINVSLFGGLPGQKDELLGNSSVSSAEIRVVSLFLHRTTCK